MERNELDRAGQADGKRWRSRGLVRLLRLYQLISGDTAVVGAPEQDGITGSAYVLVRSGTNWTEQQKLAATDVDPGNLEQFGYSVSVSGDTVLAGALGGDGDVSGSGTAYVIIRRWTWTQQ